MLRTFIFKDGGRELELPVTPEGFTVTTGVRIETVNICDIGDADILGKTTLESFKIDCLLPAQDYPFANAEMEPYEYIKWFEKRIKTGKIIRFIVSDTTVNIRVRVENIQYGENDGTNDVNATLTLRPHRDLEIMAAENATGNTTRTAPEESAVAGAYAYTVQYGDTLAAICRKNYGDGSPKFYNALARYNGKPNPNILMTGEVLQIPPREQLGV